MRLLHTILQAIRLPFVSLQHRGHGKYYSTVQTIWRVGGVLVATQVVMLWLGYGHVRWDLTEDKRFTLSVATAQLLQSFPQGVVEADVYLSGDLPAGFVRLQQETLRCLRSMQAYRPIRIRVIPPSNAQGKAQEAYFLSLSQQGIQPTYLTYEQEGTQRQQWIFPGVVLRYGAQQQAVMLLQSKAQASPAASLNSSVENIEYTLTQGIARLQQPITPRIGVIGQLDSAGFVSTQRHLSGHYTLERSALSSPLVGRGLAAVIVLPADEPYAPLAQYYLDQYLMAGGKGIFLVNGVRVAMDSLSEEGHIALPYDTGLESLLFAYGVRVEKRLVEDVYCAGYPVVQGKFGQQPQIQLLPWPFFVSAQPTSTHVITKNIGHTLMRFCSPLDTVYAPDVRKTPLLYSSDRTHVGTYPQLIGLNTMRSGIRMERFTDKKQVLGYALEGSFSSAFLNKLPPKGVGLGGSEGTQRPTGSTRLVVLSSPYFLHSDIHPQTHTIGELGMYWPENKRYSNADVLQQSLAYCVSPSGIILSRNRQVVLRPLDKVKAADKAFWQWLNVGVPLGVWLLVGGIAQWVRRRRYAQKSV